MWAAVGGTDQFPLTLALPATAEVQVAVGGLAGTIRSPSSSTINRRGVRATGRREEVNALRIQRVNDIGESPSGRRVLVEV